MGGQPRADVEALAAMRRDSAGPGERAAAEWARGRLAEAGVDDVALEPYRWPRTHAWAHLPHLVLAATGSRLLRALALVSYELDQSGRVQWVQRLLTKGGGLNVVGRVAPRSAPTGRPARTVVLVAHLDAQHAGVMWDRRLVEAGAGRRLRTRSMTPAALPAALAIATGRRALLALIAAAVVETGLRGPVPGANDNASGVAGVLDLARRFAAEPLDDAEVLVVLPGSEEAGMGGMRAFLDAHRLDPATTLVVGLDTVGSGTPVVARAEGALLAHRYREEDLALVDAPRWRIAAYTDPILARFAGLRAISILSVGEHGMYTRYHRPDDLPAHVDFACVERCADIAETAARRFAAAG